MSKTWQGETADESASVSEEDEAQLDAEIAALRQDIEQASALHPPPHVQPSEFRTDVPRRGALGGDELHVAVTVV